MSTHDFITNRKIAGKLAMLLFAGAPCLQAINFIETFDGASLDPLIWESTGSKSRTVASGFLTFQNDGGDWASGDLSTEKRFFMPPAGETTTIVWTLGKGSITTVNPNDDGKSIRYQVGIQSANEPATQKEHWKNTTGGLWIDLDDIRPTNTSMASGFARYADDTKAVDSQANSLGPVSLDWNWESDTHVLKLAFTDTEYSWFDGDTLLYTDLWANAGIDTEFENGFRVLAVGMNFAAGRGTTSIDKIEVINAGEPPALITSFTASTLAAFGTQTIDLNWNVEAGATVSLGQGIGDVTSLTVDGIGRFAVQLPDVTTPTSFPYLLTVSNGGETITRTLNINVKPLPELTIEDFSEDFDGDFLDTTVWEHLGDQTYSIANSRIQWAADGSAWSHGEVASLLAFPVPPAGSPTTITWTYGPSSVTVDNGDGTAIRPLMGIFSAFEDHPWSRQYWQNTKGGLWLDLDNMGNTRPDGAAGSLRAANDTKAFESGATTISNIDIPDWNWQTESHQFSLVLTDTGFTWFSGSTELGSGLYADYGIDSEFSGGFKIMAMGGNFDAGRGLMSVESISLTNGAAAGPAEILVTGILYSPTTKSLEFNWTSVAGTEYEIDLLLPDGSWSGFDDGIIADSALTTHIVPNVANSSGIYQIRALSR